MQREKAQRAAGIARDEDVLVGGPDQQD